MKIVYRPVTCPQCKQSAMLTVHVPPGKHHRDDVTDVEFTCWNGCAPERSVLPVRPNDNVTINNARGH